MTQVGDLIDNRYEIVRKIDEGGMSVVWLADDTRLKKMQAIKEIKKDAKTDVYKVSPDLIKVEVDIMRRLDHPNIVHVIDYVDDGSTIYIVMDYIQGKDLHKIMKKNLRVITEADVVDWCIQLCDAMGYLHSQGIVYRDMKPGNIMLLDDGTVKIIDFGIAKEYNPEKAHDTMPLGTRGYAAPEIFKQGSMATPVSDIYSLGVTLFHLVTGHGPLEYMDQPTLPPIRSLNAQLSEGLEVVVIKATKWKPSERYQSCNEMRYDLEHLENLTRESRIALERVMRLFKVSAIAGAACLVLGVGTLVAGNITLSSSYGNLMKQAAIESTEETNVSSDNPEKGGDPSPAEQLYTSAIGIVPDDITAYSMLLNDVYKADSRFTVNEGNRWSTLFDRNRTKINNSAEYAKLCYDAGTDFFIYYAYGDELTRGKQAVSWFDAAISDYDSRVSSGRECSMTASERNAAEIYRLIGRFSDLLSQAIQEGTEASLYEEYWNALEQTVANLSNADSTIVRLRLCDVVFEAINSPTYLAGFNRAGISETRVQSLLKQVYDTAKDLQVEAGMSETTEGLCSNILDNYEKAQNNVSSTYHNVGSTASSQSQSDSSVGGSSSGSSSASSGSSSSSGRGAN